MAKYVKITDNPNMGRPVKKIDKATFEKLCGMQCTEEEISAFFECCRDTLDDWCARTYNCRFSTIYREKSALGKMSLRRNQLRLAEKNAAMAIWLGKQYLGQTEKIEQETTERVIMANDVPVAEEDNGESIGQ